MAYATYRSDCIPATVATLRDGEPSPPILEPAGAGGGATGDGQGEKSRQIDGDGWDGGEKSPGLALGAPCAPAGMGRYSLHPPPQRISGTDDPGIATPGGALPHPATGNQTTPCACLHSPVRSLGEFGTYAMLICPVYQLPVKES